MADSPGTSPSVTGGGRHAAASRLPAQAAFCLRGTVDMSRRHVLGLIARLPLDAAAQARELGLRHGHTGKDGVEGGAEIPPADRDIVAGARSVELATIDEPAVGVEQEEVRRAGGVVGLRHLLRLVVQEGTVK